jgi:hypothetical protein
VRYRLAVINMCTLFEDGVATFIKTLEVQGPSSKQIEEQVVEHVEKAKPKRTRKARVPIEKTCQAEDLPVPNVKEDTLRKRKSVHTVPDVLEETVIEEAVPHKKICHSDNNISHGPAEETCAWRNEEANGTTVIAATATNAFACSDSTPDALTKLQLYASGSHSNLNNDILPDDTAAQLLLDFNAQAPEGTITGNGKKGVSFVIQGEQNKECNRLFAGHVAMDCNNVKSATLDRPITRSKSPLKELSIQKKVQSLADNVT